MLFEDEYGDIMTVDDLMKYLNIGGLQTAAIRKNQGVAIW